MKKQEEQMWERSIKTIEQLLEIQKERLEEMKTFVAIGEKHQ